MANGDPNSLAQMMYDSNPQFRQLADSVQGMTPQQAFAKYGLDFSQYSGFTPRR